MNIELECYPYIHAVLEALCMNDQSNDGWSGTLMAYGIDKLFSFDETSEGDIEFLSVEK